MVLVDLGAASCPASAGHAEGAPDRDIRNVASRRCSECWKHDSQQPVSVESKWETIQEAESRAMFTAWVTPCGCGCGCCCWRDPTDSGQDTITALVYLAWIGRGSGLPQWTDFIATDVPLLAL